MSLFGWWKIKDKRGFIQFDVGEYTVRLTLDDITLIQTNEEICQVFFEFSERVVAEYERQGKEPPGNAWYIISRCRVSASVQAKLNSLGKAEEK